MISPMKPIVAALCALLPGAPAVQATTQIGTRQTAVATRSPAAPVATLPDLSALSGFPAGLSLSAQNSDDPPNPAAVSGLSPAAPPGIVPQTADQDAAMGSSPMPEPQSNTPLETRGRADSAQRLEPAASADSTPSRTTPPAQGETLGRLQTALDVKLPLGSILGSLFDNGSINPFRSWTDIPSDPAASPRQRPAVTLRTVPTRAQFSAIARKLLDHEILSSDDRDKLADLVEQAHARKDIVFLGQLALLSFHDALTKTTVMQAVRSFTSSEDAAAVIRLDSDRSSWLEAFDEEARLYMATQLFHRIDDPELAARLKSGSGQSKKDLIRTLIERKSISSVSGALLEIAENDPSPDVQISAIKALEQAGPAPAVALLSKVLLNNGKAQIQMAALRSLEAIAGNKAAQPIAKVLQNIKDRDLLEAAAAMLLRIGESRSLLALAQQIEAELLDFLNTGKFPSLSLTDVLLQKYRLALNGKNGLSEREHDSLTRTFAHVTRINVSPFWLLVLDQVDSSAYKSSLEILRAALDTLKTRISEQQRQAGFKSK